MATSSLLWKMALCKKYLKVAAGLWISLSRLTKLACKFLHNEVPAQKLLFLLPSKLQVVFSSNLFVVCKGHTSCTEAKLWCCWKIEFFSCWRNIIACFQRGIENERFLLARSFKRKKVWCSTFSVDIYFADENIPIHANIHCLSLNLLCKSRQVQHPIYILDEKFCEVVSEAWEEWLGNNCQKWSICFSKLHAPCFLRRRRFAWISSLTQDVSGK